MPLRLSPTQTAFNAQGDGSFNTPLAEQLAFFRQKLNLPTAHYDDILKAAIDSAAAWQDKELLGQEASLVATLKGQGMTVVEPHLKAAITST